MGKGNGSSRNREKTKESMCVCMLSEKDLFILKDKLGYEHWFVVVLVIGTIYGAVLHFHHKMPEVK